MTGNTAPGIDTVPSVPSGGSAEAQLYETSGTGLQTGEPVHSEGGPQDLRTALLEIVGEPVDDPTVPREQLVATLASIQADAQNFNDALNVARLPYTTRKTLSEATGKLGDRIVTVTFRPCRQVPIKLNDDPQSSRGLTAYVDAVTGDLLAESLGCTPGHPDAHNLRIVQPEDIFPKFSTKEDVESTQATARKAVTEAALAARAAAEKNGWKIGQFKTPEVESQVIIEKSLARMLWDLVWPNKNGGEWSGVLLVPLCVCAVAAAVSPIRSLVGEKLSDDSPARTSLPAAMWVTEAAVKPAVGDAAVRLLLDKTLCALADSAPIDPAYHYVDPKTHEVHVRQSGVPVLVFAAGATVKVDPNVSVPDVIACGANANVTVGEGAKVGGVYVDGDKAFITNEGTVGLAVVNGESGQVRTEAGAETRKVVNLWQGN